jgi:hypothetical protein
LYGLELLKNRVIWRVVSGSKIKIWRDNWVPRGNMKIFGKADHSRWRWVSDLIDPTTKRWKEEMVRSNFYPPDAKEVLKIKISNHEGDNYLAWNYEKSGFFTVQFA